MKTTPKYLISYMVVLCIVLLCFAGCVNSQTGHIHSFEDKADETNHFKECSCGETADITKHTFEWVTDLEPTNTTIGYKHKECTVCGYVTENKTTIEIEKNEVKTIEIKETLIASLKEYLKYYFLQADRYTPSFAEKIDYIKRNERSPLLVKFSDECYYVAAYFENSDGMLKNYDKYTWVGFEKAEDVKESWEGKKIVIAFQIKPQEFCVNLTTDSTDVEMDYFDAYRPKFSNGVASVPEFDSFHSFLIYLAQESDVDNKYIGVTGRDCEGNFDCIELDGKNCIKEYYSAEKNGVEVPYIDTDVEYRRVLQYGEYYDELMKIAQKHSESQDSLTLNYLLFEITDFVKIIE